MGAYLIDHPPAVSQYGRRSNWSPGRPTGLTVIHTAESALDEIGTDTGAEGVAAFIAGRTSYGSYHDVVDSDTAVQLVPYEYGAFQDGTGSNGMAMAISFALRATDWPGLTAARRRAFLVNGARAFARQQAWLAANGWPRTIVRRVTRAQSDAGLSGFISHAERDPARRTDPGSAFPWAEFLDLCAAAVGGRLDETEDDEMLSKEALDQLRALVIAAVDDALIEPSEGGIGGDQPRRLASFVGRIADDAAAARKAAEQALAIVSRPPAK